MDNICFIDCETTGTDYERHVPWEIGLVLGATGEEYEWIIQLNAQEMRQADPNALRMNDYYDRTILARQSYDRWTNSKPLHKAYIGLGDRRNFAYYLVNLIGGLHLGANNVSFDEQMIGNFLRRQNVIPVWNYHLVDVESYVAGSLGVDPPWRSKDLAKKLEIDLDEYQLHSALSDAHLARNMYTLASSD